MNVKQIPINWPPTIFYDRDLHFMDNIFPKITDYLSNCCANKCATIYNYQQANINK